MSGKNARALLTAGLLVVLLLLGGAWLFRGGDAVARAGGEPAAADALKAGDVLDVRVEGLPRQARVGRLVEIDDDGHARPPFLRPMRLEGMTEAAAQEAIAVEYRRRGDVQVAVRRVDRPAGWPQRPLMAGDVVRIEVHGLMPGTWTQRVARINEEGALQLPQMTDPLVVEGLWPMRAELLISAAYDAAGLARHPEVWITRVGPE